MRNLRQILLGLGIGLFSLLITLGGIALSLTEGNVTAPTRPPLLTETPTWQTSDLPPLSPTSPPPTLTFTLPPPPTACPPPAGWVAYIVQAGDTLENLATRYQVSVEMLGQTNCLLTASILPGTVLYVPPTPTRTPVPCGPPRGWVTYIVQAGDTLYHLSQVYGVTVQQLQNANCLGSSTLIRTGQVLYVPPGPTRTPVTTGTPTPTSTPTGTPTSPGPSVTSSPTVTFTPTLTATVSSTPENSVTPSPTGTFTETPTTTP